MFGIPVGKQFLFLIILGGVCNIFLFAQIPFNSYPSWISSDISNYSTGAAWADVNADGWLDLVVSNGNDMSRQHVVVYYNNGKGIIPTIPNWQSTDIDFHGKLSIGDINNDGYPDVAVSVYLGVGGFNNKGKIKIYLNQNGTLSGSPSWISKDSMYTFSCSFGDADNDGDLDLAVACGEAYTNRYEQNRIYYNHNGFLDSLPGWKSANSGYSYDVSWADIDRDGDLDLIFGNERGPNHMYLNYGDSIGTALIWSSIDLSQYANTIFVSDINNDGYFDLAVSDNRQLGGSGRFKIYKNNNGTLETTPFWSSSINRYGSGITICDINSDGYNDLITGCWWDSCRIYINQNGNFLSSPQWSSSTSSVVEEMVCGDYDNDWLDTLNEHYNGDGIRKLFYLSKKPVQRLLKVVINNDTLTQNQFCYDLENGWISLRSTPQNGTLIKIIYVYSHDLDFAVSNWDNTIGNYIFNNLTVNTDIKEVEELPKIVELYQNYPNPFNPTTTFEFYLSKEENVSIKIFDLLGKEVTTVFTGRKQPGNHKVTWHPLGIAEGIYFYQLKAGTKTLTQKMIILN